MPKTDQTVNQAPTIENAEQLNKWGVFLLVAASYLFSVAVRFTWINLVKNLPSYFWNNTLMTNTHDSLYWGSMMQKALFSAHHGNSLLGTIFNQEGALPFIGATLVKIFSLQMETVMLYLPVFATGLIVVPIILIGRLYNKTWVGFCASLLTVTGIGLYCRTLAGYFDTDVFVLTLLMFGLYFLLAATKSPRLIHIFLFGGLTIVAPFFYIKLASLLFTLAAGFVIYGLIWKRREPRFQSQLILLAAGFWTTSIWSGLYIGNIYVGWLAQLAFLGLLYYLLTKTQDNQQYRKTILYATIVSVILWALLSSIATGTIRGTLTQYLARDVALDQSNQTLYFSPTIKTVSEAQTISFATMAYRVSGNAIIFLLSLLGYALLAKKRPEFLIGLPFIGLAFFSMTGGSRFAIFATPIMALGIVFLIDSLIRRLFQKNHWQNKPLIHKLVLLLATIALLFPNIAFIRSYAPTPVLLSDRLQTLDKLTKIARPTDYVISWWDYGSATWFYSGLKTIASPNYQDTATLFVLSKLLTADSPTETANLMRWAVEKFPQRRYFSGFSYEALHPIEFLTAIKSTIVMRPEKTSDTYLFLPIDILPITYPVATYSNIDLLTGQTLRNINFVADGNYQQTKAIINMTKRDITLDFDKLVATIGNQPLPIKAFHIVYFDKDGKLKAQSATANLKADLHAVVMPNQHAVLIMDNKMFNSSLIQMLVFENYDASLFEPVFLSPNAKIYRLKI